PNRNIATSAIELLASEVDPLEKGDFAGHALPLLFPSLSAIPGELVVRGTRDWVLFCRRREQICSGKEEVPTPALPQTDQVSVYDTFSDYYFNSFARFENETGSIQGAFRTAIVPVDQVQFAGGDALVVNPDSNRVRQDWLALHLPKNVEIASAI